MKPLPQRGRGLLRPATSSSPEAPDAGRDAAPACASPDCRDVAARPKDCRGYVCWNQEDDTVFRFAQVYQLPVTKLRKLEADERKKGER